MMVGPTTGTMYLFYISNSLKSLTIIMSTDDDFRAFIVTVFMAVILKIPTCFFPGTSFFVGKKKRTWRF